MVLDVANPLVFTAAGPALSVANTDSLAETLQRAFPRARVVKSLNTMNAEVMVDPARVPGEHVVFVAGDDAEAKATVSGLLGELGWPEGRVVDLGGLAAARGLEGFLLIWLSIAQAYGTFDLNIAVQRALTRLGHRADGDDFRARGARRARGRPCRRASGGPGSRRRRG